MKERPILFSAPMVRAVLDGSKTQTRRVMKGANAPSTSIDCDERGVAEISTLYGNGPGYDVRETVTRKTCPYGQPGDRLWVRETWLYVGPGSGSDLPSYVEERKDPANHLLKHCWHRATFNPVAANNYRWTPSIHMYRWASRINLEITDVRVERLQDISEADAQAEGCSLECMTPTGDDDGSAIYGPGGYIALWESINGAGSWSVNPWVWVIEFKTGISPASMKAK